MCIRDRDVDTLHVALGCFLVNARVGGKRSTGHGLLDAVAARHIEIMRPAEAYAVLDAKALAPTIGSLFRAHVAERKDRIATYLSHVEA